MNHFKKLLLVLTGTLLVATATSYASSKKNNNIDGILLSKSKPIANFQMTDNQSHVFTKENLKGHWTMMFFGFTHCGYVCPTTMSALGKMYQMLEKELPTNQLPRVVMVSVDPERDSVQTMDKYVRSFNSHFVGVRGNIDQTSALQDQLHITATKMQAGGSNKDSYTINHSAEIILFNPNAEIQAYFSFPHQAERMVQDYKSIIS